MYKPIRGEVPLWDFPDGTLAGREVAAYLISEALGWSVIPETILRDGPFGPGMVQRWVEAIDDVDDQPPSAHRPDLVDICPPEMVPENYKAVLSAHDPYGDPVVLVHADDPRLERMAVLDIIINNADRKGGHVLESYDGSVYGVDHGICLHVDDKLRTVLWGWAAQPVPGHLLADVAEFVQQLDQSDSALRASLADHITEAEIDAAAQRARELVVSAEMPSPPPLRPIPWPPF